VTGHRLTFHQQTMPPRIYSPRIHYLIGRSYGARVLVILEPQPVRCMSIEGSDWRKVGCCLTPPVIPQEAR
jgi:hypothetical protein